MSVRAKKELGQHFLVDENILGVIGRLARLARQDVALEIGPGLGVLTTYLADRSRYVHAVELDRTLEPRLREAIGRRENVELHFGDALHLDLAALEPAPTKVVSNLPYSVATPLLLRTIDELPGVGSWTVMVQREIADRLRAAPANRTYGSPSVLVQLAADVEMLRTVDRAVFTPRPRVDSALLRLTRRGPAPDAGVRDLVRAAFAHRRKAMTGSLELGGYDRDAVRRALREVGLPENARAEALAPPDFVAVARALEAP